jgi:heptaprenyl diphosphate synthase
MAILVAIAATLQIAESLIPKPLPWLRLGLANGVTLLVLLRAGAGPALGIVLVRVALGGLVLGTIGSPAFVLSLAGSLGAWAVMAAARWGMPPLSPLGVSVLGASAHVAGQLTAFGALFGLGGAAVTLAPALAVTAVPLGLITGAVIVAVHRRLPPW